jgi:8-oxo-dGTP pyrophosphatase MutT (NUDIX family)
MQFVAGKRQNTDHFCGFYGLPGGKPDPGETPEDTILRELREETGIVLEPADIHRLGEPVVYPLTGDRVDFTKHDVTCQWFYAFTDLKPTLTDEKIEAWESFPVEAPPENLMPGTLEKLRIAVVSVIEAIMGKKQ